MSNKLFTTVPVPKFPRSQFNLSRPVLFTPRMHKEYPTEILEVIPGDGFKIWAEAYAKSQPMVAPTFAKMDVAQESFFVPAWQLSERFDDFITGGERGMNTDKMPYLTVSFFYERLQAILSANFGLDGSDPSHWEQYNEALTMFQDILESMDVMRSVPFIVPDFAVMSGSWSASIATANFNAFDNANNFLYQCTLRINLLPFAAVLKIWCEYYRDENLCEDLYDMFWKGNNSFTNPIDFSKAVGDQDSVFIPFLSAISDRIERLSVLHALFGLRSRAWKKDYFTSALPFVQKGPDVMLPLSGTVPVSAVRGDGTAPLTPDSVVYGYSGIPNLFAPSSGETLGANNQLKLTGDLSNLQLGSSIQDVRTAFKLEELYEADGRFGNRYPENTLGQFGVRTPDSRLPRCQFLGGCKQPISIQQVVQNSSTDATSPQGNLAGLSSSYGSNKLCKTYQSQHGFLVAMTAIRVHSLYQQGIHPMFSRYDRTEYAWPRFANLGEQPIYTKQLFIKRNTVAEDEVFGYTPRYADYKSDTGSIHGKLKGSLNYWTMCRRFANKPVLNEEFIYNLPRQDAFVVTNWLQPCFIMELDYHVKANRVLPFYGTPHI